jgi:hypothetical protein
LLLENSSAGESNTENTWDRPWLAPTRNTSQVDGSDFESFVRQSAMVSLAGRIDSL